MRYEPLSRRPARHFLPAPGEIFRPAGGDGPLLEWRAEGGDAELLLCDGRPVARLARSGRRWWWGAVGADAPALAAGFREEARRLAEFYARRISAG